MNLDLKFGETRPSGIARMLDARPLQGETLGVRLIGAAIAICLLLQLHLVFVQPINWDEFRFLGDVHLHGRGELSAVLLTFHIHFFGWLVGLGDEINQIWAARLVMLGLETGTLLLIWTIARQFFGNLPGLFAALGYVSFSFVLQHGASFRFDPIAIFLVMASVALLLRQHLTWTTMGLAGLALAVAAMVTVKVALALPLIVAVGVYRLYADPRRPTFLRLSFAAASSVVCLAALYGWHLSTLADGSTAGAREHLAASYSKTLAEIPFFPSRLYFWRAVTENPLHWTLLLLGVSAIAHSIATDRARSLVILAFVLPLLSITFYRNAFPYYYGFILAPTALFFAATANRQELRRLILPAALIMTLGAVLHHGRTMSPASNGQQYTVSAVHEIFPRPVAYIDRCSMIASFPQASMFLSTLMMGQYVTAGQPIMRDLLTQRQPVFLIANNPALVRALENRRVVTGKYDFLPDDGALLRDNFIHHWGPIYVTGKSLAATPEPHRFEILVGGPYTVESERPIWIDDRLHRPGEMITLRPAVHLIRSATGNQAVTLRWGNRLKVPTGPRPIALFGRF